MTKKAKIKNRHKTETKKNNTNTKRKTNNKTNKQSQKPENIEKTSHIGRFSLEPDLAGEREAQF